MNPLSNKLTIGALAEAAGVHVETIRFYQRKGLMAAPDRPLGSIRRYGQSDFARVRFIKAAQRIGFTLDDVAELLKLEDGTHCDEARRLAAQKLQEVRERLADLHRMETVLTELIDCCASARGKVACPLITVLQHA
jgi:MerR family mercuric resistance operon transcriptional regulator